MTEETQITEFDAAMADLDDRERAFVEQVLLGKSQVKAAQAAGLGTTYFSSASQGSRYRRRPNVRRAIEARMRERAMTADEAVARMARIARSSMSDVFDYDPATGRLTFIGEDADRWEAVAPLVKKLKTTTTTIAGIVTQVVEVEMVDRYQALRDIARINDLFTARVKVETWRDEVLRLLAEGEVTLEDLREEFDDDTVAEIIEGKLVQIGEG